MQATTQQDKKMNAVTELRKIQPDTAKQMLATNTSNRPIRKNWVEQLSKIILDDEFISTHQGIAFDVTGKLIDGQHRLLACIKANKPITVQVTTGLPISAWYALDQGVNRSYSDLLEVDRKISDVVGRAHRFFIGGKAKPTDLVVIRDSIIGKVAEDLIHYSNNNKRTFSSAAVRLGAVISVCMGADRDYVFSQYKSLVSSDFDSMSEITKQFYKQGTSGQINPVNLFDTFGKSLVMFEPRNSALSRFVSSTVESKLAEARTYLSGVIGNIAKP